ncbi:MAG: TetR/AcrR family transcriptional regulator [Agathobacter sp.]
MGSNQKTTDFLKECMADALLQSMKDKTFSKITVNEIANIAGVNRSTWFRNFTSKNEAVTFKLVKLWYRWADEHDMKERCRYVLGNAETFFDFNYSIREILFEIYRANLQPCVYDAFYQVMMPQYGATPAECYEARFYSYGLFGLLDEWIKRGFYETPAQLTSLFLEMMKPGDNSLITNAKSTRPHGS